MLKGGDAFTIRVAKQFSVDGVVGYSKLTPVIPIGNMDDFNGVCEDRQ